MTVLSVGQLQGLNTVDGITVDSSSPLRIDGTLRVSTIRNTSGINTLVSDSSGNISLAGNVSSPTGTLSASGLSPSALTLPSWSSSTRPSTLFTGTFGYNSEVGKTEVYTGSSWSSPGSTTGSISSTNLVVRLDATSNASYPGSGTVWYDTSGNNNHFNIVAAAYNSTNKYMDFNGSYGCAKNSADISLSGDVTYVVVTRMRNSTSGWRTLTRSYVSDHHVMGQDGGWALGIYDNDSAGFISSGYSQQQLPGYTSNSFQVMIWRWTNSDNPSYSLSVNGVTVGNIVNSNARYNRGFGAIGAYHNENTTPSSAAQGWGDIKFFAAYSRRFSDSELVSTYNALSSYL